jgi:hypothetical protein
VRIACVRCLRLAPTSSDDGHGMSPVPQPPAGWVMPAGPDEGPPPLCPDCSTIEEVAGEMASRQRVLDLAAKLRRAEQ